MPDKEIWKDIEGYEGLYQVSNMGRVRRWCNNRGNRLSSPEVLRPNMDNGYRRVGFGHRGNRKMFRVHVLVAKAFIPNPENKTEVNHIDGNRSNNNVKNLEWTTHSENVAHAYRTGLTTRPKGEKAYQAKLTNREAQTIKREYIYGDPNYSFNALARKYGVSKKTIMRIVKNEIYKE